MKNWIKRTIGDLFSAGFSTAASPFNRRTNYKDRRATFENAVLRQLDYQVETQRQTQEASRTQDTGKAS